MHIPAVRMPQHKSKREDSRAKELSDLKRENHQLRRKVSRLEKILLKYQDLIQDGISEEEIECQNEVEIHVSFTPSCSKCGGTNFAELAANNKIYVICKNKSCLNRWIK